MPNPIPKKLHAVWLGGLPPGKAMVNIQAWRHKNPDYEMNLWIDTSLYPQRPLPTKPKGDEKSDETPYAAYKEQYEQFIENFERFLIWANHNEITIHDLGYSPKLTAQDRKAIKQGTFQEYRYKDECSTQCLLFEDASALYEHMPYKIYYDDEVTGVGNNKAAGSDMIRVEVLYYQGGVYFDATDVFPGTVPLGTLEPVHGFYCDGIINAKERRINNDFLCAVPKNHIIARYREAMLFQYGKYYENERVIFAHRDARFASSKLNFGMESRLNTTKHMSGPTLLHYLLKEENCLSESAFAPRNLFRLPEYQALSWLPANNWESVFKLMRTHIKDYFETIIKDAIDQTNLAQYAFQNPEKKEEDEQELAEKLDVLEKLRHTARLTLDISLKELLTLCESIEKDPTVDIQCIYALGRMHAIANAFEDQLLPFLMGHYNVDEVHQSLEKIHDEKNPHRLKNFIDSVVLARGDVAQALQSFGINKPESEAHEDFSGDGPRVY